MLKIVSIHIPKTAGTSFYSNLQDSFGKDNCIEFKRVDVEQLKAGGRTFLDIAAEKRLIHGHIYYNEIRPAIEQYQPKVICWIRNPLERLFSDYLFFIQKLNENPADFKAHHHLNLHRKNESFYTYAARTETQNVMSKYLGDADWKDFFFIGETENYSSDLDRLAHLLGKKFDANRQLNKGRTKPFSVDDVLPWFYDKLCEWNALDLKLYAEMKRHLAKTNTLQST